MKNSRSLIHYCHLFASTLNIKLLNHQYTFIYWTYVLNNIINFNLVQLKCISLSLNYALSNNDIRILFRESSFFLTFLMKTSNYLSSDTNWSRQKIINVIRSPFATSISKEHFGFFRYILNFELMSFNNILILNYLIEINAYLTRYNDINVKKYLQ